MLSETEKQIIALLRTSNEETRRLIDRLLSAAVKAVR